MNKYIFLCLMAGLVFLPACKTKREKKIEACQKELKECNEGIAKESRVLQREKTKLKKCVQDIYVEAAGNEVEEQTAEWAGCEK